MDITTWVIYPVGVYSLEFIKVVIVFIENCSASNRFICWPKRLLSSLKFFLLKEKEEML